jgi:hypothetical protein
MPKTKKTKSIAPKNKLVESSNNMQDITFVTLTAIVMTSVFIFVAVNVFSYTRSAKNRRFKSNYKVLGESSVRVFWSHEVPVKSRVEYGTTEEYLNSTDPSSTYSEKGHVLVSGLLPNKPHVFRLVSYDEKGNEYSSKFMYID